MNEFGAFGTWEALKHAARLWSLAILSGKMSSGRVGDAQDVHENSNRAHVLVFKKACDNGMLRDHGLYDFCHQPEHLHGVSHTTYMSQRLRESTIE